jgi:transcriptional regulator with XRE-family HTH domain
MNIPKKATALVLAGAVGLASAAYGIGSAVGGGSATAGSNGSTAPSAERGFRLNPPPAFDDLAEKLGVDADELAEAMKDFHDEAQGERRDDLSKALADALGISVDKVNAAFDEVGDGHKSRFAAQLANELGLEAADVEAALEKLANDRPESPADFAEALAGELGVDAAKVESALEALRPRPGARPPGDHRGAPLRKLAAALDVTRAELRKALGEVRAGAQSGWEQHEAKLAAFLAERFNLDAGEVQEALADLPHPKTGPGPRGPGGPGFGPPGPGGPGFAHGG